ncbi:MAG: xanthine dehydrogenase family protein [Deltaproteobacteria bacterium]|nr:xanthine dehydrogenase family protein [Deltaproteobacteria bacterium]
MSPRSDLDAPWLLGRPEPRVDGLSKVTGEARFAADLDEEGQLWGAVLRSSHPHARVLGINTEKALGAPGVVAVMTAADIPGEVEVGGVVQDQPVLAVDRVRFLGDGLAVVAAETEEEARAAVGLIEVEYEPLPVMTDPRDALEEGAEKVHDGSNEVVHHKVRHGDANAGFEASAKVYERSYSTPRIEHSYLEPEAVIVRPVEAGVIDVVGSIQNLFSTRRAVARVLGVPLNRVTVRHAVLGGSFGGKDDVMSIMACRAALLASRTRRPVKMVNTREESMLESYKRHPYFLDYRVGIDAEGRPLAMRIRAVADAGAYVSMSPFVTFRSVVQASGPYSCPNVRTDVYAAYTNNNYTGAMRGFGSPQVNFAIESLVDEIAEDLGEDPLSYRLRIAYREGDVTPTGQVMGGHVVSLEEVLRKVGDASGFADKWRRFRAARSEPGVFKKGIGIACSYRGVALGAEGVDAAAAMVQVQSDGSVIVSSGVTDMGQGAQTAIAQCAAEVLGVPLDRLLFLNTDTSRIPDSGPTVASRGTIMGGSAVADAAGRVRRRMLDVAADMTGIKEGDLVAREGAVFRTRDDGGFESVGLGFDELAAECFNRGRSLAALGWFNAPPTSWKEEDGQGTAYFTYVYGANVAEVEVDTETGRVRVKEFWSSHDLGRAVNMQGAVGQVHGGVAMGLGYGLLEEFDVVDGRPVALSFDEYLIPTAMDVPRMHAIIVENPDPAGALGQKSLGEPTTEIAAPAIVNAVANATGRRIREIPATLERVLLGRKLRAAVRAAALRPAKIPVGSPAGYVNDSWRRNRKTGVSGRGARDAGRSGRSRHADCGRHRCHC